MGFYEPFCPYCEAKFEVKENMRDEETYTKECNRCKKEFVVVCEITTLYDTRKKEDSPF